MTLTRCSNGHFYDEDKFNQCPHCDPSDRNTDNTVAINRNDNVTVGVAQGDQQNKPSQPSASPSQSLTDIVGTAVTSATSSTPSSDSVTVSYYMNKAIGVEPVVGWMLCVEGSHLGEDFRLKSGRNFIGRSTAMDVSIAGDNTVSREKHAIVLYDPENHRFLVQPGDARELCYLNDKLVLSATDIKVNDVLKVGSTKLMFFPSCTDAFHWGMVENGKLKADSKEPKEEIEE